MDSPTQHIPVDTLHARAREVHFGRMLVTAIAACFLAIGWGIGRLFLSIGWLAGRVWLVLGFCAEAVIYGFQVGAKIPPKPLEPPEPPK